MTHLWLTDFIDLCVAVWPQAPGIAPNMVKWELLRIVGLCVGVSGGVGLACAGVVGTIRE